MGLLFPGLHCCSYNRPGYQRHAGVLPHCDPGGTSPRRIRLARLRSWISCTDCHRPNNALEFVAFRPASVHDFGTAHNRGNVLLSLQGCGPCGYSMCLDVYATASDYTTGYHSYPYYPGQSLSPPTTPASHTGTQVHLLHLHLVELWLMLLSRELHLQACLRNLPATSPRKRLSRYP